MFDPEIPVKDLMSRDVVTISQKATLARALATLREYTLGSAPVVDEHGSVVGVFSLTDAARQVTEGARDAEDELVASWMTEKVRWLPSDATAGDVARLMAEESVHHIVILENGAVRGIVSSLDVVRAVARSLPPKRRREPSAAQRPSPRGL